MTRVAFPGRDAARSSCGALLRRTGIVPDTNLCTAPALQRTAPRSATRCAASGEQRVSARRDSILVRRDFQEREGAEHAGRGGRRGRVQKTLVQLGKAVGAEQAEAA